MTCTVTRIATTRADLYAFRISGEVSTGEMERMSETMNEAFDQHEGKVDMLMVFEPFAGSEGGSLFDGDVIASRLRSIVHVDRYVVVGAPEKANAMIEAMGKLMPVEPVTYPLERLDDAWRLLDAQPTSEAPV